jgi:Phage capsid scaffolding protein (GPO) serine peptidase
MDKKPKKKLLSKWVRIAVEGATCDKRTIERQWIEQMADTYSPKVYGARINLEHLKGILPDGPFQRYGDVAMVKKEEIAEGGPLKGKLALLARLAPTDSLVEMNRKGQKVYTSVEVDPNLPTPAKPIWSGWRSPTIQPASVPKCSPSAPAHKATRWRRVSARRRTFSAWQKRLSWSLKKWKKAAVNRCLPVSRCC